MSEIGETTSISAKQAFEAFRIFLDRYWERGLKSSEDIGDLLIALEPVGESGMPLDRAQWSDWLDACSQALGSRD